MDFNDGTNWNHELVEGIVQFYVRLIETEPSQLRFHLAENAVLDWFGLTVRGDRKVHAFFHEKILHISHHFSIIAPSTNVTLRSRQHMVKVDPVWDSPSSTSSQLSTLSTDISPDSLRMYRGSSGTLSNNSSFEPSQIYVGTYEPTHMVQRSNDCAEGEIMQTPRSGIGRLRVGQRNKVRSPSPHLRRQQPQPVQGQVVEMGQGDGLHNNHGGEVGGLKRRRRLEDEGPPSASHGTKRLKSTYDHTDGKPVGHLQYVTCEGHIQFHRSTSKKMQVECKWKRACKMHLGYTVSGPYVQPTIYVIIYEGSAKCKRNLLKDFCTIVDDQED